MNFRRGARALAAGLVCWLAAGVLSAGPAVEAANTVQTGQAAQAVGQSKTRLANGDTLILGGKTAAGRLIAEAQLLRAGGQLPVASRLQHPRAYHTATTLPNGKILILGGIDADGQPVKAAELFDPVAGRFESAAHIGLTPRAGHSATVLTDGRLVVAGGWGPQGMAPAELWDYRSNNVEVLTGGVPVPRAEHTATLLPDGRVLILGGYDESNRQYESGVLFDPDKVRFIDVDGKAARTMESVQAQMPRLAGAIPAPDGADFPVDGVIALRFSQPLQPESVNGNTVTVNGPGGNTAVDIVTAEEGRLVFLTPQRQLFPASRYAVFVNGAITGQKRPHPFVALSFGTAKLPAPQPSIPADFGMPRVPAPEACVTVDGMYSCKTCLENAAGERECSLTSQSRDGFWKPGVDNTLGRWRLAKALPKLPQLPALKQARVVNGEVAGTLVYGQVLRLDDRPLPNVEVSMGGQNTRTDAQGYFALSGVPAGKQTMFIDGATANQKGEEYAQFIVQVDVHAKQPTQLPHLLYVPRVHAQDKIRVASPTERDLVLTHPNLAGLEVHIPKGTVFRDRQGRIVTELAIVPVPVNRAPFPLPENFPVYFIVQPGGLIVQGLDAKTAAGIKVVYPNTTTAKPGQYFEFWDYEPGDRGWYVYGMGQVSADGRQIVPNADVRLYTGMGFAISNFSRNPPAVPPCDCECCGGGDGSGGAGGGAGGPGPEGDNGSPDAADPVNLFTGVFVHHGRDVVLNDILPIEFRRTYRTGDTVDRPFGKGTMHSYGMYLYNPTYPDWSQVWLVLPNSASLHFRRISPGTDANSAVWEYTDRPGRFFKAQIKKSSTLIATWELRLKDGTVYEFSTHGEGALIGIRDRFGNRITITRSAGLITRLSTPSGRYLDFSYDANNHVSQITDLIGRTWNYAYNAAGLLQRVTYPDTTYEEYAYDTAGRMLTVKDRRGNIVTTNEYDAQGRVKKQTLADGAVYQFAYTLGANEKISYADVTDPLGYVRRTTFSSEGYVTSNTRAVGTALERTITFERQTGTGLLLSRIDGLGRKTAYTYDAKGNVLSTTRLAGTANALRTSATYTGDYHQLASSTDAQGQTTTYRYGLLGQLTEVSNPLGLTTRFDYNVAGQIVSVTDALQQTTRFGYDGYDLQTVTDPLNRTSRQFTDAAGRLAGSTDPLGQSTRYDYDSNDRVTQITDPAGQATQLAYDGNGNLRQLTDARGAVTQFSYDGRNRKTGRIDPLNRSESFGYDRKGNLTQRTDRKGQQTNYHYDAFNRRLQTNFADGGRLDYTWDAGDRLLQASDSQGGTITRSYDEHDRLSSETTAQGTVGYRYDQLHRRIGMTVSGQEAISYSYDVADRLLSISQGGNTVQYRYDEANRRTRLTLANGIDIDYSYDAAGQLTRIEYKNDVATLGDLNYSYDAAGRRTGQTGSYARTQLAPATAADSSHDLANELQQWNGQALHYDANGNLLGDGTKTYTWDARNRLIGINGPDTAISYGYDVFNRRIKKVVGSTETIYVYDRYNLVQEKDSKGQVVANILQGHGIDEFLMRIVDRNSRHYLVDGINSTLALLDDARNVKAYYTYELHGATSVAGDEFGNSYAYTGRENDGGDIYYFRSRYYSVALRRWLSEDPIGFGGGVNFYQYVDGNPNQLIDPLGLRGGPGIPGWGGQGPKGPAKPPCWSGVLASAINETVAMNVGPVGQNNAFNALLHCHGVCRLYKECGSLHGAIVSYGHEIFELPNESNGNNPIPIVSDTAGTLNDIGNNAEGRACSYSPTGSCVSTATACMTCCMGRLYGGRLSYDNK